MKIYLTSIFLSIAKSGTTVTEGAEGAAMPASAASCAFFEESSSTLPSMRFWIIQSGKIVHRKKAPQRHSGYCHTPYRGPWQDSACGGSPNEAFLTTIMLHRKKAPQKCIAVSADTPKGPLGRAAELKLLARTAAFLTTIMLHRKKAPQKAVPFLVEHSGFEPLTSTLPV